MSRKLKKIFLKVEWINLENEETDEILSRYNKKFANDFSGEISYLNSSKNKQKKEPKASLDDSIPSSPLAQKIYRNLAKKVHPDVSKKSDAHEVFKRLSKYYENNNLIGLISISNDYDIILPDLCSEDFLDIEKEIIQAQKRISQKKTSLAWVWATSKEDKDKLKKIVYQTLDLDENSFLEWKKNN